MARPLLGPELRILRLPFGQHARPHGADVLLLVDRLHFGEFRQLLQTAGERLPFHALDGDVHPDQRTGGDEEQQHEAAGPDAGEIVERAEGDRQHEAAETADHADQAADRADIVRVVDRDMLVHRGFAQAHEEAEHENQAGEGDDTGRHVEVQRAIDGLHDIVGGRIGQDEGDQRRDAEHPVHDAARAIAVGQHAAIDAEQACRDRIGGAEHAGGFDVELVDADQIARQPQRQRDESAEGEEIIERETPDLDVLQRLELEPGAARPFALGAARELDRVFLGEDPEHHAHDGDGHGPDLRGGLPAISDQHERRAELGHRRADIAGAENPQRGSLFLRRIPA